MKCCNENWTTNFCPTCGKQLLPNHPLIGLLAHCRSTESGKRVTAGKHRKSAKCYQEKDVYYYEKYEKMAAAAEANAEKWKSWGDELQKLIASSQS
jgi:hypothetical protein